MAKIIVPHAGALIFAGLRLGLAMGFIGVVIAELLITPTGVGDLITYSADWEEVSMCESSGNWHIDSHHDGGLQFLPATWLGFGGGEFARYAYQATKNQQIYIAERVLAIQGSGAWPTCFRSLPIHF